MTNKRDPGVCTVCGKPLKMYTCPTCGGSGKVRLHLVLKRGCEACGGTGWVRRCPDQFAHLVQAASPTRNLVSRHAPANLVNLAHRTCPMCKGTRGVRLANGQAGPCPTCKGRGWV